MGASDKLLAPSDAAQDRVSGPESQLTEEKDESAYRQHLAVLIANLCSLAGGAALGWTSPALPLLQRRDPDVVLPLVVDVNQGSWIGGFLPVGALVGAMPAGLMGDKMGRKTALLSLTLPYVAGWLCIISANEYLSFIYIGRFIIGFALGASNVLIPQYSEEVAEDSNRGALGVYLDFSMCNGSLLVNILGTFFSYICFTIVSGILPVIFFASFYWMPESPVYLIETDRLDEAQKALMWLRKGKKRYDVQAELNYLRKNLLDQSASPKVSLLEFFMVGRPLESRTFRTMVVVYGLVFFQQTSGSDAMIFYSVSIFTDAGVALSGNVCSIIASSCQALADLVSSLFVDRVGRRPMLLMSAAATALPHAALSAYFHFKDLDYNMGMWTWVPLAAISIFMIGFSMGFSSLPWVIMAEVFPTKMKYWADPGAVVMNWGMVFLITKEFPTMEISLGRAVTYGVFCVFCVASFVFVLLYVPETKMRTREQIQEDLRGNKKL